VRPGPSPIECGMDIGPYSFLQLHEQQFRWIHIHTLLKIDNAWTYLINNGCSTAQCTLHCVYMNACCI